MTTNISKAKLRALWDAVEKLTDWSGGTDFDTHIELWHDHIGAVGAFAKNGEVEVARAWADFDGQDALIALAKKLEAMEK